MAFQTPSTTRSHASVSSRPRESVEDGRILGLDEHQGRWLVQSDWRSRLFSEDLPDWFHLEGCHRAECVKVGRGRSVFSVALGAEQVFVKVFDRMGPGAWWPANWLLNRARREWRAAKEAARRGLPVAPALALGCCRGRTVLITMAVRGTDPVTAWTTAASTTTPREPNSECHAIISGLARFLACSHDLGLDHLDGHPRNVVIDVRPGDQTDVAWIDLHPVQLHRSVVPWRRAVLALARLDHAFRGSTSQTQRFRFLQVYLSARRQRRGLPVNRAELRSFLRQIRRVRRNHALRLAARRDRRLSGHGSYFTPLRLPGGWLGGVMLKLGRRSAQRLNYPHVVTLDEWCLRLSALLGLRSDPSDDVSSSDPWRSCTIERHGPRNWFKGLSWTMTGGPHRRAFESCHRRLHRDLPAELILGYMVHRRWGIVDQSLLFRYRSEVVRSARNVDSVGKSSILSRGGQFGEVTAVVNPDPLERKESVHDSH